MSQPYFSYKYWEQVKEITDAKIELAKSPKLDYRTLAVADVLVVPIAQYREFIQPIVDQAKDEFHLSQQIEEIKNYWNNENIDLVQGNSTSYVFGPGVNQSLKQLDDHLSILETCDIDSLHLEVAALSRKLTSIKQTMQNWMQVQEFWKYLTTIH